MIDKCPMCGARLNVSQGSYHSAVDSTEVFLTQNLNCSNPQCDNCKNNVVLDTIEHKLA